MDEKMIKYKSLWCVAAACLLLIILLNGRTAYRFLRENDQDKDEVSDTVRFEQEFEKINSSDDGNNHKYIDLDIASDNGVKYQSLKQVLNILEKGTGVIFLGVPNDHECRSIVPILLQARFDTGLGNLYYVNISDDLPSYKVENDKVVRERDGSEDYQKLVTKLEKYLDKETLVEDGKEYVVEDLNVKMPTVIFVREGEILGVHVGSVASHVNKYEKLDEKQQEELYNVYTKYIHDVLNDLCDERC